MPKLKPKNIPVMDEAALRQQAKYEGIADFLTQLGELIGKKNRDYGDDNIKILGQKGVYVRMSDKMARLKTWMWHDVPYMSDETFRDTLLDLAGYCMIAALLDENRW